MSMTSSARSSTSDGQLAQVSVIVPTRDRPGQLGAALGSIAAQDLVGDVEVIVVNDGGAPVDPVVHDWQHTMNARLIDLHERVGPAAARNRAIDVATGRYLAFLDDDDLMLPGHLAAGCVPLDQGEADFVYLGAVVADHRLGGRPDDLSDFLLKAYPYDQRFLQVANFLHTGSVLVRSFRDSHVRFDEDLDVCEDWDLWLALTEALNYRVAYVDQITSVYHQVPSVQGLVADAQLVSPSRFAVARDRIHGKWPTDDPLVAAYREWMDGMENYRDALIKREKRMPNLLFDEVLAYVHARIAAGLTPDYDDISAFFPREPSERLQPSA